jgi:prevent-host-death family protein
MTSVGIRDLKARLSSYIERVKNGEQLIVTDSGEEVAIIMPISSERRSILSLVKEGKAAWSGSRPKVLGGITLKGKALSETVIEERQ